MSMGGLDFAFGLEYDVSGLDYRTVQQSETDATVIISGEMIISVMGIFQSQQLSPTPLPMIFEDGRWKVCEI
jgi:hypothetical protein